MGLYFAGMYSLLVMLFCIQAFKKAEAYNIPPSLSPNGFSIYVNPITNSLNKSDINCEIISSVSDTQAFLTIRQERADRNVILSLDFFRHIRY